MLRFNRVLVMVFALLASAFATAAFAQRGAGSKISGDYNFYGSSRSRPSYSIPMYSPAPTARRSFSYDATAPRASNDARNQSYRRSYSYQTQCGCVCR